MRLTRHTDYAMRVLLHLGVNPDRPVPVSEIALAHGISHNHLVKVAQRLAKAGFVENVRGRSGGARLAVPATSISLGEIVRRFEPDMRLIDCRNCAISPSCALPRPFHEATAAFLEVLDRHSLADAIADSRGLGALLAR